MINHIYVSDESDETAHSEDKNRDHSSYRDREENSFSMVHNHLSRTVSD